MQNNDNSIVDGIKEVKYDSVIFIFGYGNGEYFNSLIKKICSKNNVIIIEANEEIYNNIKDKNSENIRIILFDKNNLLISLLPYVNITNFSNLYVFDYNNYKELYKEEYAFFIETIDNIIYSAYASLQVAKRFNNSFLENIIKNLDVINNSISINSIFNINKDVPAFIISAGPSLDESINILKKNIQLLDKSIVISGTRTLKALIDNNIIPDYVVTVDPVNENYEMVCDCLNLNIPIVFYEYSNSKLLNEYKGQKIFYSLILSRVFESFKNINMLFMGGSVAHTQIDFARKMGCKPIILIGQDLAYPNNRTHADAATFDFDKNIDSTKVFDIKDIKGNLVKTDGTLNQFRKKIEEYIYEDNLRDSVKYYNTSKGANINGTEVITLDEIFKLYIFNAEKSQIDNGTKIEVNKEEILDRIISFIDLIKADSKKALDFCIELESDKDDIKIVDLENNDQRLSKFIEIYSIAASIEIAKENLFYSGYFNKFQFDTKNQIFNMLASDYERLTSNLKYQSKCFKAYFTELINMLDEVTSVINKLI